MMLLDLSQVQMYLEMAQSALATGHPHLAEAVLAHARSFLPVRQSHTGDTDGVQLATGIGLDPGIARRSAPNEDYAFAMTGTRVRSCGTRVRSCGTSETFGLFIVADGMGGHARGDEASRVAVHACADHVLPRLRACLDDADQEPLEDLLVSGVQRANLAVYQQQHAGGANSKATMGTTMTAVLTAGRHAWVANVGDSRAYLSRGQGLFQLTEDHSIIAHLVKQGELRPEGVATHPARHQIYRCLGAASSVEVDLFPGFLQDGDRLLLCSDGLWGMVPDGALATVLAGSSPAEHMARALTQLAWQGGGIDNIGLVVVQAAITACPQQGVDLPLTSFAPALAL